SEMEYADLRNADLRGARLTGANLDAARLDGAFLATAWLDGASFLMAHFDEAFLWETHFEGAMLREAHLEGVHIDRAVFADSNGVGPQMVDVRWGDANLATVDWSRVKILAEEARARETLDAEQLRQTDRLTLVKDMQNVRPADARLALYDEAVRANRQLALALRGQGLNEDADRFAYRAQVLQRTVFRRQRRYGQYLFSLFLDGVAGYGYRIQRIGVTYVSALTLFALLYFFIGQASGHPMSVAAAIITSVTAFHGRVFAGGFTPGDALSWVTAAEAVIGVIVEGVFIAMLTQRFFGR
ncbi:MAG TPA: pentapeptide repeat-containing protein, partial [Ktedonobacterales bacterium]|nr:pentapeptide repeat-containing protein [Ktedonobacterales bacterium]